MNTRYCVALVSTIVLASGLGYALFPIGSGAGAAAAFFNVFITDPADSSRAAHVDSDGNLQVTGNLGITGTPSFELTGTPSVQLAGKPSVELVPATPVNAQGSDSANNDTGVRAFLLDVPPGQIMIVEFVSVFVSIEKGLVPICSLETNSDADSDHYIPVVPQTKLTTRDFFVGGLQTRIYAGAGRISMQCASFVFSEHTSATARISGYLVNASE